MLHGDITKDQLNPRALTFSPRTCPTPGWSFLAKRIPFSGGCGRGHGTFNAIPTPTYPY